MKIPDATELAEYSLAQQHPVTVTWSDREHRLQLLAQEHGLDVRMATDLALATSRRDHFAPELSPDFFLNSWFHISDDLDAMLSMRYEGGDPGRPFVDASALTRPLVTEHELDDLAGAALARFGLLRPRYVRWWSREPAGRYRRTRPDKRFLAAPLHELTEAEAPEELRLSVTTDLRHYPEAQRAYEAVDRDHPDHPDQAVIESYDDLDELRRSGTVYDVMIDGTWSGYVAVERGHKLGLAGFTIAELLLVETARGRGYGRYLTTLLARTLADKGAAPTAVIIGTIHYDNLGARQAAEQAGRHDIGGWTALPLDLN